MAVPVITKPTKIDAFFAKYPNALAVYFDEDGANIYLEHFLDKALIKAKQEVKRLYKTVDNPTIARVYPTSFLYSIKYNDDDRGDIINISIDGEDLAPLTMDESGIASAFDDVLQNAGILAKPTEVIATAIGFDIRVITSDDTEMEIKDENGLTTFLTQTFL